MVKVTINGEVYSFDNDKYRMSEAIELEKGLGMPFGEWETSALGRGSAVAMAGFVWLVLKRAGRGVPLADILSGKFPLNTDDVLVKREGDGGDEAEGPTIPPSPPAATSGSGPSPSSTEPGSSPPSTPEPSATLTGSSAT
jgi:hypothetical protein